MEIQREKRIGILGGSFNPTHNAHIRMGRTALWELHLDEVRFLISRDPPHKHLSGDVTDTQRLEMLKLAISVEEGFCVDERELHREGKSYTVISLEQIALEQPDARLYLIVGSDMLKSFCALLALGMTAGKLKRWKRSRRTWGLGQACLK
jgi:nicotinate-nucleotide adenylyltransferase